MSERDRRRLASRISLLERVTSMRRNEGQDDALPARPVGADGDDRVERLEARVQHLEIALEGLQDAVHRDATRYDECITDLQRKIQPGALAQAMSADARQRGL